MAAWWLAGDDRPAHTGAAVTRPLAAMVEISSGGSMALRSKRERKISLASVTDFICLYLWRFIGSPLVRNGDELTIIHY
jgi:hypothetical protein